MSAECLIQVFARVPTVGQVKTRLIPALGEQSAARLHIRLVEHALATAAAVATGTVELWTTAATTNALVDTVSSAHRIYYQPDGDLGTRMHAAALDGLRRARAVVIVGTDCPAMVSADIEAACRALENDDAVLGPAEDGGYWLIGLRRLDDALFDGVPWSTQRVLAAQRDRLRALGWRWQELRTLWDIDRPEDFERLRNDPTLQRLTADLLPTHAQG